MDDSDRPRKLRKLDSEAQHATTVDQSASDDLQDLSGTSHAQGTDDTIQNKSVSNGDTASENVAQLMTVEAHNSDTPTAQPLSKNQRKKLEKKAAWEAGREGRKVLRKERVVAKRERKKAAKEAAIAQGTYEPPGVSQPSLRPVQLPITIIVDCDFDDLMNDSERMSLGAQLTRSYSDNKKSTYRAHLAVSSFGGKLKERFDGLLKRMHESWQGVRFLDGDFVQAAEDARSWMEAPKQQLNGSAFQKYNNDFASESSDLSQQGEIVYLSSDADETLEELKPFSTYIVGGLVDRNREKGLCHRRATERGVRTARLPIGSYMDMQSRKVLATNHVVEIMLKWLELDDWGSAFVQVIPKRKGGTLKDQTATNKEDIAAAEPA